MLFNNTATLPRTPMDLLPNCRESAISTGLKFPMLLRGKADITVENPTNFKTSRLGDSPNFLVFKWFMLRNIYGYARYQRISPFPHWCCGWIIFLEKNMFGFWSENWKCEIGDGKGTKDFWCRCFKVQICLKIGWFLVARGVSFKKKCISSNFITSCSFK